MFNLVVALICAVGLGVAISRGMTFMAVVQTLLMVVNLYYAAHILLGGL